MWQCYGVQAEEAEVDKHWTSDKSYVIREYGWPEFEVQVFYRADTGPRLILGCRSCDWEKRFHAPVPWSVLSSAVSRHGMTHVEEDEG
jgi:hypothetical protein